MGLFDPSPNCLIVPPCSGPWPLLANPVSFVTFFYSQWPYVTCFISRAPMAICLYLQGLLNILHPCLVSPYTLKWAGALSHTVIGSCSIFSFSIFLITLVINPP